MKARGAVAEVFLTAFMTLPKREQNVFLTEILKDNALREDVMDIAIAESRARDKGRRFRDFLKAHDN